MWHSMVEFRLVNSWQFRQDAQLSQRDHTAGWISFGEKWNAGTGRRYFTHIIGQSSTTVTVGWQSYQIRRKKAK